MAGLASKDSGAGPPVVKNPANRRANALLARRLSRLRESSNVAISPGTKFPCTINSTRVITPKMALGTALANLDKINLTHPGSHSQ